MDLRKKTGRNTLGGVVGDPGSGKTYWCMRVAELLDQNFNIDNVVFNANSFVRRAMKAPRGTWLVYDEPGVTISNRTFMSGMNMIINFFLQSSRYRQVNALFALPSLNLMDLGARTILLFQALMRERGTATLFRIRRNQFGQNPPYWTFRVGSVTVSQPSGDLMKSYEAKRKEWHEASFTMDDSSEDTKPPVPAFNLVQYVKKHRGDYEDENHKISVKKIIAKHEVGTNSAYRLKAILEEGSSSSATSSSN
jgi:hypothetical protein